MRRQLKKGRERGDVPRPLEKLGAHEEKLPKILYESSFGDKKILLFPPALGKYR